MIHRHALEESSEYRALWRKTVWILNLLWIGGLFSVLAFTRSLPDILNPNDYSPERHELIASEEEEVFRQTAPHTEESEIDDVPQVWRDRKSGVIYHRKSQQIRRARSVVGVCQSCILILFTVLATLLTDHLLKAAQRARDEKPHFMDPSPFAISGWLILICALSLIGDVWDWFVIK